MSPHPTDVLIIGGGVIGLSCARELLDAGRSVRLLDAGRVGHGSSWGNCGLVTPSHALPVPRPGMVRKTVRWMFEPDAPFYVRPRLDLAFFLWGVRFARRCTLDAMERAMHGRFALLASSRERMDAIIRAEGLDCEWVTDGLAYVYTTEAGRHADDVEDDMLDALGIAPAWWSGERLRASDPALRDEVIGARYFEVDAHLRPACFVQGLERSVRARGATLEDECTAEGFTFERDGVTVATSRGPRRAATVVLATGAWSGRVGRTLGLRLPIQPGKGYTLTGARPDPCPRIPYLLRERSVAVTPWPSGLRLGGTMEFTGFSTELNERRMGAIRRGAAEYLRALPEPGQDEKWYGWRPMTPDGLPVIDRAPRHQNVIVVAGHNMLGLSMAAGTGRLVREMITGEAPHIDPAPYAVGRF